MRIKCIAVGKNMPAWVNQAVNDYQKRLQHEWPTEIIEVAPSKRIKSSTALENMNREAVLIEKQILPRSQIIVTEVSGKMLSSRELSEQCAHWMRENPLLSIIIGGPDGIAPSLLAKAHFSWSLSPLTLPHPLVRIILMEQLYRAWSMIKGHPYHRG